MNVPLGRFSCNWYNVATPPPRVCQGDGHWTGEQPECIEVFCSVPVHISHAILDVSTVKVSKLPSFYYVPYLE